LNTVPAEVHAARDQLTQQRPATPARRGAGEEVHDNAVRALPEERAAELAARTLAFPDAQSVEDLTALLTSAEER
jgi:hypothetical protein